MCFPPIKSELSEPIRFDAVLYVVKAYSWTVSVVISSLLCKEQAEGGERSYRKGLDQQRPPMQMQSFKLRFARLPHESRKKIPVFYGRKIRVEQIL